MAIYPFATELKTIRRENKIVYKVFLHSIATLQMVGGSDQREQKYEQGFLTSCCSTCRGKNKVKLSTVNNDFLHYIASLVGGRCDRREQNYERSFLTSCCPTCRK